MIAGRAFGMVLAGLALASPALAHHPMGGASPETLLQGMLSGVAHPVIGYDHLAFLLAAGFLAGAARLRGVLPGFLLGGLAGALIHLAGFGLGPVELVVALTVVAAGIALLAGGARAALPPFAVGGLFAAAGLFHGHALMTAVEGSPPAVVAVYLVTLGLAQGVIGGLAILAGRRFAALSVQRLAGAGTAAVGAVALVLALTA